MQELSIDLETYSPVDLNKSGVHKYVAHPDFQILLCAYQFDNEKPRIIDLTIDDGDEIWFDHEEFLYALTDPKILKTAYNAVFELICLGTRFRVDPQQWDCTMVRAMMLGLPSGLYATGIALALDSQKDKAGTELIKYFCVPCKPTKTNGERTRNFPHHDPDKWAHFKRYCIGDVIQERKIRDKLKFYKIPPVEKEIWQLDFKINKTGIELDQDFIHSALKIAEDYEHKIMQEAVLLTGLDNPKSVAQVKKWIEEATGQEIESLNEKSMPDVLKMIDDKNAIEVLRLRGELSKTSNKKYDSMLKCVGKNSRARGLLQYYGAARTGRWTGRLIQIQNLKRNTIQQLDLARRMVATGDLDNVLMIWNSASDILSQCIRTAFVAPPGKVFAAADFSAVEARVTAWLAGEEWRLEVFKTHGKIYEAIASQMFKIPIEKITKDSPERFKGKCAELALGFGGGPPALINIGALQMGMKEEELPKLVRMWRNINKKIFKYWYYIANHAIESIENPGIEVKCTHGISFLVKDKRLWLKLPSGRHLFYLDPKLHPDEKGNDRMVITYSGVDQYTKKFERLRTYGGKLVENIVQAIARDLLAWAMLDLDKAGFKIVMHIHDEVVMEINESHAASEVLKINKIMTKGYEWCKGLPLGAETTINKYYKK